MSALRGLDIEDPTGLIEGQTGGGKRACRCNISLLRLGGVFGSRRGLFVSLCEGSSENSSASDDDLCDDAMSLRRRKSESISIDSKAEER